MAQVAEEGTRIPLPVLVVLGVIILGGAIRLLFGGGNSNKQKLRQDPADSPEYYLIERDDHWESDGYVGEDDDN